MLLELVNGCVISHNLHIKHLFNARVSLVDPERRVRKIDPQGGSQKPRKIDYVDFFL